jgi:hypothetical protein
MKALEFDRFNSLHARCDNERGTRKTSGHVGQ